jgi:hypothetical protein
VKAVPAISLRVLLALAVVVLGAHLLLLRATPGPAQVSHTVGAQPFVTRSIAALPSASGVADELPSALAPDSVEVVRHRRKIAARASASNAATAALSPAPLELMPTAPATPASQASPMQGTRTDTVAFMLPGSRRLHYQVSAQVRGQSQSGEGALVWRHDGEIYEAKLDVRSPLLPTRTQRSMGHITAQGLAPLRFSDKTRSEEATHFERDKDKVSFSSNRPDAPLLAGAQDRLSVLLQLGAMIGGEPQKYPQGAIISVQTAGTREADSWLFKVEQEEELQLPGGAVGALKLIRHPLREFDQKVELWLARAMDYVPVRLRLTQPNGDSVDLLWSSTDRD